MSGENLFLRLNLLLYIVIQQDHLTVTFPLISDFTGLNAVGPSTSKEVTHRILIN